MAVQRGLLAGSLANLFEQDIAASARKKYQPRVAITILLFLLCRLTVHYCRVSFQIAQLGFPIEHHYPACVLRLQALVDDVPGILQVEASYIKQKMDVRFDDTRVTEAAIMEAVKKAGYTAVSR